MSNSTKVWLFIGILSIIHLLLGYQLGGRLGLFIGFVMATSLSALILAFGDSQILQKLKARQLEGQDAWGLNDKVFSLASQLGLRPPNIYIIESSTPTAFATSQGLGATAVCFSTGLLKRLSPREIDAVITYQVCQIQHFESFLFNAVSIIANSFVGLASFLDQLLPSSWLLRLSLRPFTTLISPLAWLLIRTAISSNKFFENDDLAASVLHDKGTLARALWKMDSISYIRPLIPPPCTSHLFIVNPLGSKEKNWFYLPHPKTATRIKRLVGYYPI